MAYKTGVRRGERKVETEDRGYRIVEPTNRAAERDSLTPTARVWLMSSCQLHDSLV